MFEVKIRDVNFAVTFSFFAVCALIFLSPATELHNFFAAIMCCFFHETGHLFFMFLFGEKPLAITLTGAGIKITPKNFSTLPWQDILILLGGCIFNFLAGIFWLICGKSEFFCCMNFLLAAFNLLPFSYFDGGRVLKIILGEGIVYRIIRSIFLYAEIFLCIFMLIGKIINLSLFAVMCSVIFSDIICEKRLKFKRKQAEIPHN